MNPDIYTVRNDIIQRNDVITSFWKSHPEFWIPISETEKQKADKVITELFFDFDYEYESVYGKVIYLDQFFRHFQRYLDLNRSNGGEMYITEKIITHNRKIAKQLMLDHWDEFCTEDVGEIEIIFGLMPFKHLGEYDIVLDYLDRIKAVKPLSSRLSKFYNDTYEKAYNYEAIKNKVFVNKSFEVYNYDEICDYYPEEYKSLDTFDLSGYTVPKIINECFKIFDKTKTYIVSLSGGVDSMVMLALLKKLEIPVIAVHIVYGNRKESVDEYNFISHYCQKLKVKLYVYNIERLKRSCDTREFYEEMTRTIRFNVYNIISEKEGIEPNILLGHIQDDVIENIWSNFASCQHLNNLKKMKIKEHLQGSTIIRPFLNLTKDIIYSVNKELSIPYLKNTTPSWSNRGKFRNHFYKATHDQYGASVDSKIIEVATLLEQQSSLIEKLLYKPIFDSYNSELKELNITVGIQSNIGVSEFNIIFEHICHKILLTSKPSIHSIRNFCNRMQSFVKSTDKIMKVNMKKDVVVSVNKKDGNYIINF